MRTRSSRLVVLLATLLIASCSSSGSSARQTPTTGHAQGAAAVVAVNNCATAALPTPPALPTPVDHFVTLEGHRIHVREWAGTGPTILLMHGFPDNLHLYDELVPQLAGHHVVAFDFIGWGDSDKPDPTTYPYKADQQIKEVNAVVTGLNLAPVVAVVHDSSGPPGIDWAMQNQSSVSKLVLLNTYYSPMPTLRPPEAIAIFSAPSMDKIHQLLADNPDAGKELYYWQVGGFFKNKATREKYLPQLWAVFPTELPAFRALNLNLLKDVGTRKAQEGKLAGFSKPVTIAFGADDPYLNVGVANVFHGLFPHSQLVVIPNANHYVQMDQPQLTAKAILGDC